MPKTRVVNIHAEECDVYIGRPSDWGNPFEIGKDGNRDEVIRLYAQWFFAQPELVARARRELRGKRLGCHCAPKRCHGDVLRKVADGPPS